MCDSQKQMEAGGGGDGDMRLGRLEFLAMNNPLRRLVQKHVEFRIFDYMPEQVRLAQRRGLNVEFLVGDLRGIECESSTCDAVFIFGVLHHIAEWKTALCEVARVLKPGGVLLFDEPRYLFTWGQLEAGTKSAGMDILEVQTLFFHYFHAYLCQKRFKAPAQRPPA